MSSALANSSPNPEMHTVTMLVTPDQARQWLTRNSINRPLRPTHIRALARRMDIGEWMLIHQGIALSPDMTLLDGQHRLYAIIAHNKPVMMSVTFNQDPATFPAIDDGKHRSASDTLHLPVVAVAIARWILRLRAGTAQGNRGFDQTNRELGAVYAEYETEILEIHAATMNFSSARVSAPIRTAALARMLTGDRDYTLSCMRAFSTLDTPVLPRIFGALLRSMQSGVVRAHGSMAPDLMIRAWLAFDPARANLDRLTYRDPEIHIQALEKAFVPRASKP